MFCFFFIVFFSLKCFNKTVDISRDPSLNLMHILLVAQGTLTKSSDQVVIFSTNK